MTDKENPSEISTGKLRAERLLSDKKEWQRGFYQDTPHYAQSRQVKRRNKRKTVKMVTARVKRQTIAKRRQKMAVQATEPAPATE